MGDPVNQTHLRSKPHETKTKVSVTLESCPRWLALDKMRLMPHTVTQLKVTASRPALIPFRPSIGCFVGHGRFAPARLRSTFPNIPDVATSRYHIHSIIQVASQHTAQVVTTQVVVIPLIAVETKGQAYTPRHGIRRRPVPSNLCKTFTSSIFARQPQPVKG